ncbi:MAG: ketopantoate reductase C-terminal domain-containing protein [Euryarchaeota archaeon]|nr:ketopantoate reductase C-terminal domain-containing protein [Euryarchaeota archaeon]
MLDGAGIPTKPSDSIMREIWHKSPYNIALNPLSAIFQVTYGQIADNPDTRWLIREMTSEAFHVAEAADVDLGMATPDEYLEILWNRKLSLTRDHRSSMLQDIIRGKRTEIDYINEKVVELGREYRILTPYSSHSAGRHLFSIISTDIDFKYLKNIILILWWHNPPNFNSGRFTCLCKKYVF